MTVTKFPRGIRNNNPGNIRISKTDWKGEIEGDDKAFETFETPEDGIRAIVVIIKNYARKYGLNTVQGIIHRWAPVIGDDGKIENDTNSYVSAVSLALGVRPVDILDLSQPNLMAKLVKAIIRHENGLQPYSDAVIMTAVKKGLE